MQELLTTFFNYPAWMHPAKCVPSEFFRLYVLWFGIYIGATYGLFAYISGVKLRAKVAELTNRRFPVNLAMVFIFCMLAHLAHTFGGYLHQSFKLLLLPVYPFLAFYHTRLLMSTKAINNMKKAMGIKEQIAEHEKLLALNRKYEALWDAAEKAIIEQDLTELKAITKINYDG